MKHIGQRKSVITLLLIFFTFTFTGCFEIIEEVELKEDGSGSLSYTLNLSQSKTKINSALLLDSFNGFKIPDEQNIKNKINELLDVLRKSEGLSNVNSIQNFDNYIFTFSCDFETVENLNQATKYLNESYKNTETNDIASSKHFTFNKESGTFKRKGNYGRKANPDEVEDETLTALNQAEFTSIYRFSSEVSSVSNKNARISPNKKAVMLKHKAMDIATGKQTIENIITLK